MIGEGRWWRGLDSNQCTLSGQIYSLMDLTTLPPLHYNVAWVGKRSAVARRRGGLWWADDSVSTPLCQTTPDFQAKFAAKMPGMCKKLRDHPDPFPQGVAFNGELALMPVASVTDRAGIAQW